ncbi:hypothetical protein OCU04_006327 [Sclerotinia nivalis]|uniref:Uncharacterized protein n=1 Tax=Sclerotinia nivalis TaxID=352851 RepID=A0A9X0DKG2_9HELO|nr:hypothetical protein OCU04_006327 [Sclerotinia nivalis]
MARFRNSSSGKSSEPLDSPTMKDNTLSSEPPFMFNAVDTDYPIVKESNEMTQQERHAFFPRFSQTEADRLRIQDITVQYYLSQTPTADFAKFNEHHIGTNGEVYDHRKYAEGKFIREGKENGEKEEGAHQAFLNQYQSFVDDMKATDKYEINQRKDSKISQRTLRRLKETYHIKEKERDEVKEEKSGIFPIFLHGSEDAFKDIDEDNIETDEEKDENDSPWYKRSKFSLFGSGRTKEVDEPEVFPFFDPTASGNVPVEQVSEVRGNSMSSLAIDMKSGKANGFREERRGFRHMGGSISEGNVPNISMRNEQCVDGNDLQTSKNTPCEPVAISDSDPPFHTEISYSSERDGEIIESEPVTDDISVINKIFKAPPEKPRRLALRSIRRKTVALPAMLKRRWSQTMNDAELKKAGKAKRLEKAKKIERAKKAAMELTSDELILWHRQEALKALVGDSPGEDVEAMLRTSNKNGTKDLENQVYQMTSDVPHVRTCSITKSDSVKSVVPIIENDSKKARSMKMAQERVLVLVLELQKAGYWPPPIPEETARDSSQSVRPLEHFNKPSSSNDFNDETQKHTLPMSEAATKDSSPPFQVPGPFSKPRPSPLFNNKSIDEIIHSQERGLPMLEHTTKESLPIPRNLKRFDTPISSTGKGINSQSDLALKEQGNPEASTSMATRTLRRSVKGNSLHRMFMKGFEKHEDYRIWGDKQIAKYKETAKEALKHVIDKRKGCLKLHKDFRNWEDAWIDKNVRNFMGVKFSDTVKIGQGRRGDVATIGEEGLEEREERAKDRAKERAEEGEQKGKEKR